MPRPNHVIKRKSPIEFEPQRVLGKGFEGTATVGKDTRNDTVVVQKLFRGDIDAEELAVLRKIRKSGHPHLLKLLDDLSMGPEMKLQLFYEYCSEGDLRKWVKQCKPEHVIAKSVIRVSHVGYANLFRAFQELASALAFLHYGYNIDDKPPEMKAGWKSIFHRDIKPDNVFIKRRGEQEVVMVLGDFGFATELDRQIRHKHDGKPIQGDLRYVPPEYNYTVKGDVWALGSTMYEVAHGDLPYDSETGKRIPEKRKFSDELETLMRDCVNPISGSRPNSLLLMDRLESLRRYAIIANDPRTKPTGATPTTNQMNLQPTRAMTAPQGPVNAIPPFNAAPMNGVHPAGHQVTLTSHGNHMISGPAQPSFQSTQYRAAHNRGGGSRPVPESDFDETLRHLEIEENAGRRRRAQVAISEPPLRSQTYSNEGVGLREDPHAGILGLSKPQRSRTSFNSGPNVEQNPRTQSLPPKTHTRQADRLPSPPPRHASHERNRTARRKYKYDSSSSDELPQARSRQHQSDRNQQDRGRPKEQKDRTRMRDHSAPAELDDVDPRPSRRPVAADSGYGSLPPPTSRKNHGSPARSIETKTPGRTQSEDRHRPPLYRPLPQERSVRKRNQHDSHYSSDSSLSNSSYRRKPRNQAPASRSESKYKQNAVLVTPSGHLKNDMEKTHEKLAKTGVKGSSTPFKGYPVAEGRGAR